MRDLLHAQSETEEPRSFRAASRRGRSIDDRVVQMRVIFIIQYVYLRRFTVHMYVFMAVPIRRAIHVRPVPTSR